MISTINRSVVAGGLLAFLTAYVPAQTLPGTVQTTLVVTPGSDPAATLLGAVRFRNFPSAGTENEIWVGVPPLSAPPASEGADLSWASGPGIHVSYSPASGLLSAVASTDYGEGVPVTVAHVEKFIGNVGSLNYVEVTITKNVQDSHLFLGGVLNPPGEGLGGSCFGCFHVGLHGESPGTYNR